jgi:hypothetical protein
MAINFFNSLAVGTDVLYVDTLNDRVGIGTTSPNAKLSVKNSSTNTYVVRATASDGGDLGGIYEDGGTNAELYLKDSAGTSNVLINSSGSSYLNGGNIGIGTSSPSVPLTVQSNSGGIAARLLGRSSDGYAFFTFRNNADSATNGEIGVSDSQNMLFYTGASERLRIGSAGQIGIGGANYGVSGQVLTSNGSGSAPSWQSTNWSEAQRISNPSIIDIYNNNNGNVGIGTSTPDYDLDVAGEIGIDSYLRHNGDSNTFFGFSGNDEIKFRTAGSDRVFINSSGNVGIGTTSPINGGGNAKWITIDGVSGNSYSGGVIYSIGGSAKGYHYVQDNNIIHQGQSGVGHRFIANAGDAMTIVSSNKSINHIGNITSNAMQRPVARWGASGSSTGMIAIALPGDTGDYDMTTIEIEVYEYNSNAGSKIRVSGHTWTSGIGWYNYSISTDGVFNKSIYLGKSSSKYYILLGDTSSSWNYGSVIVRANTEAEFYNNVTPWGDAWSVTQVTTDPTSSKTSNLNTTSSRTSYTYGYSESGSSFRAPIFYDSNNTAYYLDPNTTATSLNTAGGARIRNIDISPSSLTDTIQNKTSGGNLWLQYGHNGPVGLGYGGGLTTAYNGFTVNSGLSRLNGGVRLPDINGTINSMWGVYGWDSQLQFSKRNISTDAWEGTAMFIDYGSLYVQSDYSFRAPIFYDTNDTNYYLNANSTSRINQIDYTRLDAPSSTNDARWQNHSSWGSLHQTTDGYIQLGPANTSHAHIYTDRSNFYFNKQIQLLGGSLINQNDIRSAVFYDINNTNYYLNPADSNLSLKAYGEICNSNYAEGNLNAGSLNIGRTDTNYIFGGQSNWPSDIRLGILANCANEWEFGIHDSGTSVESVFLYQNSSGLITMGRNLGWGSTPIVASDSFRAPVFYDSANTGYYIDPASTSIVNTVTANDALQAYHIGIRNTSNSTKDGISLYGGATGGEPTYGIMFTGTSGSGTYGAVTGDWATYFTMNNDNNRGWIFRRVGSGNAASISGGGIGTFNGVRVGGTGTANELDDYEEGTWTATFGYANFGSVTSYAVSSFGGNSWTGRYVKIGRLVHCTFYFSCSSFPWSVTTTSQVFMLESSFPFVMDSTTRAVNGSYYTFPGFASSGISAAEVTGTIFPQQYSSTYGAGFVADRGFYSNFESPDSDAFNIGPGLAWYIRGSFQYYTAS